MLKFLVFGGLIFSTAIAVAQHGGAAQHAGGSAGHAGFASPHMTASPAGARIGSAPLRPMGNEMNRVNGRAAAPRGPGLAARPAYGQVRASGHTGSHGSQPGHRRGAGRRNGSGYARVGYGGYALAFPGYPYDSLDGGLYQDGGQQDDAGAQGDAAGNGYAPAPQDAPQPYDGPYDRPYDNDYRAPLPPAARPAYTSPDAPQGGPVLPRVALVFKDGHRLEIQNYVATRSRIIVRDSGSDKSIPVSSLDLAATLSANQAAGTDFSLPGIPPGQ